MTTTTTLVTEYLYSINHKIDHAKLATAKGAHKDALVRALWETDSALSAADLERVLATPAARKLVKVYLYEREGVTYAKMVHCLILGTKRDLGAWRAV